MNQTTTAGIDLDKVLNQAGTTARLGSEKHCRDLLLEIEKLDLARRAEPSVAADERALFGFDRDDLEAIADGLETGYEKGVDVGGSPLDGNGANLIESTTAAAARFIRAALASPAVSQMDVSQSPLTDEQLDQIARAYFAEEYAQGHVKNAIHDAFVEAGRAALARAPLPAEAVAIRWPGRRGGKWEFADINDTVAAEVLQNPKLERLYLAAPAQAGDVRNCLVPTGEEYAEKNQRVVGPQWLSGWNECRAAMSASQDTTPEAE